MNETRVFGTLIGSSRGSVEIHQTKKNVVYVEFKRENVIIHVIRHVRVINQ